MIEKINRKVFDEMLNIYAIAMMDDRGIQTRSPRSGDACTNSYSVAKFFTMTAIGMLWDPGKLRVEDKVVDIFREELPEGQDPKWQDVTVEHVLKHTVGFGEGFLDIDVERISDYPTDDFLQIVLARPLTYQPGEKKVYSDAAYYLLSRIVTKCSGKHLDELLRPVLFDVLGFQEVAWSKCPRGFCMGATGLYVRTPDMVKMGYVYACGGKYQGKTVVSEAWVRQAVDRTYCMEQYGDSGIYSKGGMYGQMLLFSPQRRFACAWQGYEPRKSTKILFKEL